MTARRVMVLLLISLPLVGCKWFAPTQMRPVAAARGSAPSSAVLPSHARNWEPEQAELPYATFRGHKVKIYNIRNNRYVSANNFSVRHENKTFDLEDLDTVEFIVVPFKETPALGHTMLSFGFRGEKYLAVSVEVRKEKGETYHPIRGLFGQYELMYVVGDERDLIGLRAVHREDDVYLYRARATPEQARALFIDVFKRVNAIHEQPEFYHTLTNNCTSNLAGHVNRLAAGRIPYDKRLLLTGQADRLAYDLRLLDTELPFEEARRQANISHLAREHADSRRFSQRIRRR